ncbi:MAG TPA: AMP-binding protein [Chloroflexota bacterium]|nr:AMP-binding protein [Chloroflexota bacterium]
MTTVNAPTTYDREMFRQTFEQEFTYINGFARNVHRYAGRPALTSPADGRMWTYAELDRDCNRLANALLADGVGANDVVMFQLHNCPEFAMLYLAPKKIGAISCPINFRLAYGETAVTIDDSRPAVFVYEVSLAKEARQALNMAQHKPRRVVVVDNDAAEAEGVAFDEYLRSSPDSAPPIDHPSELYDETTRLYTSGTTGMPKGVPLNNLTEVMSAHDVIMHFPLSPRDKTLNMTPWFHRGGLYSGGPNPVFYSGAQAFSLAKFDANAVLDYVEKFGITFLIGAPTNLKMLADAQQRNERNLETLKGIVTMGAPLEREACIRFQEVLTSNIFNGYGTTEAFWNTFLRPYDLPEYAGTAGRSCTDDDVAVVHVYDDRLAEPDDFVARDGTEVGEIIVRAPTKCTYTYIDKPDSAARTFYRGWVYIGDLGTWDANEYVTVVGRKDDMIISGGENVHPVQVEEVLNEHPKVTESVVVGVPDKEWGELVVAYVVSSDPTVTAAELNRHCANHPMLARYKRPRYYRFVESVPMTATGKKQHYKLKEQAARDFSAGLFHR